VDGLRLGATASPAAYRGV